MNGELLSVLDYIEREKGIKREILVEAVEAALASAARKVIDKDEEISVKLDDTTGAIKVFSGETEVKSAKFGRIAAQTAKQVIIQKIREAERDVIFEDFKTREGTIVTGMVHRFEKGNIIVDLGRPEGILSRDELLPRERYRQGERIKAYVVEVQKTSKGPNIVLSRKCEGMVKKLFEQEVPEISDGIVEIKSIAREPGERTKIAVSSKDERIDSVGACVGMRGQRVKNIVRELQSEKIDIVRYNDDIREFVKGALSPAEIGEVKVDKENKKISVIVDDEQLSLAIGKRGQNVRLASRLIGYEIDVKGPSDKAKKVEAEEGETPFPISELPGVGKKTLQSLKEAGFNEIDDIAKASAEDLSKIPGIGKKTAEKIYNAAMDLKG